MPVLRTEVLLATCTDERYPPTNMIDGNPSTFFVTTGSYPQEILLGFKTGAVNINRILLVCSGVKGIRIERSTEPTPVRFEPIVECELKEMTNGRQLEQFQVNANTTAGNVKFLKLHILSGYDQFAGVYDLAVEGEEIE